MLGATLVILTLIAAAWYVAKVGTVFTLLFIGAVVLMAYKRLPLIAFTLVFTLLLAAYTFVPPWKCDSFSRTNADWGKPWKLTNMTWL